MSISPTNLNKIFEGLTDKKALENLAKLAEPKLINDEAELLDTAKTLGKWIIAEGNLSLSTQRKEKVNHFFAAILEARTELANNPDSGISEDDLQNMNLELMSITAKIKSAISEAQLDTYAQKDNNYNTHDQLRRLGWKQNSFKHIKDNVLKDFTESLDATNSNSINDQKMRMVRLVKDAANKDGDFNSNFKTLLKEKKDFFSQEGMEAIMKDMEQGYQESSTLDLLTNKHLVTTINNQYVHNSLDDFQNCVHMPELDVKTDKEIYELYKEASENPEDIAKVNKVIGEVHGFKLSKDLAGTKADITKLEKHINERLDIRQQAYLKEICRKKGTELSNQNIFDLVQDLSIGGVATTTILGGMLGGLFGAPVMGVFVAFVLEILSKLDNQAGANQTTDKELKEPPKPKDVPEQEPETANV